MKEHSKNISIFGFIGYTMHSFAILLETRFSEKGIYLNLPQYIILNILNSKDGVILEDLSKILNKDKSAVLRHVNHLENEHFIARMTDKKDRRRKVLIPTKIGMEVILEARIIESELNVSITSGLEEQEIKCFKNVLLQMNDQTMQLINKK